VADATYNYQFFVLRMMRVTGTPLMDFVSKLDATQPTHK
jgi:hypothetical protein